MPAAERLAWRWVIYNEKAADELSGNPRAMTLYYEELCARPPEIARALFRFVELDWHPQSQQFVASSTSTASTTSIRMARKWRWRNELGPAEAERVGGRGALARCAPVSRTARLEPRGPARAHAPQRGRSWWALGTARRRNRIRRAVGRGLLCGFLLLALTNDLACARSG
jgi:hypothetical protein